MGSVLIKVVLMVAIGGIALFLLRGHAGARHTAIRRLLLVAFVGGVGVSVLFPQLWTMAAEVLGVGRGTDLLLYATIVAFLGFVATSYLRFRDMQRQITTLTRRIALDEAHTPSLAITPEALPDLQLLRPTLTSVPPTPAAPAATSARTTDAQGATARRFSSR